MTTFYYTHPGFIEHDTGPSHPERRERVQAIERALAASAFAGLVRHQAPMAGRGDVLRVHTSAHVDAVEVAQPLPGQRAWLDADTVLSHGSIEAAWRAAGAGCAAVDAVVTGAARNAFCAVRPPGHHAEPGQAMGFCLFNNAAIAALHARAVHGLNRVAVVDFDVHHGNGTQAAFWHDADAFYASSHQMPAYPGSGSADEVGAHGNIVNVPLAPGAGSEAFRRAYQEVVLPSLRAFSPDFLVISAGFDAHVRDPLADLCLETGDFGWVTHALRGLADEVCAGRVVSVLEGGYDLEALGASVAAHVAALMA